MRGIVLPAILGVFLVADDGHGQRPGAGGTAISAGIIGGWSAEADFRLPWGYGLRMRFGRVEFGYERASASRDYIATTCAGLVPPGVDCSPEPIEVTSDHTAGYAAVPFTWPMGVFRVDVTPEIGVARFEGARLGQRSGRSLSDAATFVSLGIGGRAAYRVLEGVPLNLVAGAFWRAQFEMSAGGCVDCYRGYSGLAAAVASLGIEFVVPGAAGPAR